MTLEDGQVKCAAKYCRSPAKPHAKYCEKHDGMTGGEMLKEMAGESSYTLTTRQAQRLIDYAIDRLMSEGDR